MIHTAAGTVHSETLPDNITSIACTSSGNVYLTSGYSVHAWNTQGLLLSEIASITSDCSDFYALAQSGLVYRWAHIHRPKLVKIHEKVEMISCGAQHCVFLSISGSLFVMGNNSYGQISLGKHMRHSKNAVMLQGIACKKVVCGGFHTLVFGRDEVLYSCGLGNMGQLVNGKFVNEEFLTPCVIDEEIGEVIDIYCTEMTSFVKVMPKSDSNLMTFRPSNLEPKNSFLAFIHRQIVADAERKYLAKLAVQEKHKHRKQQIQLERENNIQKTLQIFQTQIIPNWPSMKSDKKVADLVKKGLPSKVRGVVWRLLVGNPYNLTLEIFQEYLEKARGLNRTPTPVPSPPPFGNVNANSDVNLKLKLNSTLISSTSSGEEQSVRDSSLRLISLDIARTFNNLGYFSAESPMSNDLRELLEAASVYRSDIGYIQGMSYVAGMLLLNLELLPAFQVFISVITTPLLISFYKIDQEGIGIREVIFVGILKENLYELYLHLESESMQPAIFLMEWFVTLYSKTLCQEVAVRVWDLYFYFGPMELFKAGIGIMKILNEKLIESDLAGIMETLTHINELVTDPDELVNSLESVKISEHFCKMINNL